MVVNVNANGNIFFNIIIIRMVVNINAKGNF